MAKKDSATATQQVEVSDVNSGMIKSEGHTPIRGEAPGTYNPLENVFIDGIGNLDQIPEITSQDDQEEGVGEYCVVLADMISGTDGRPYKRGDIRRLSKFVLGLGDPKVPKDIIKQRVKRIFSHGALRLADSEEAQIEHVELPIGTESEELRAERNKRIAAEKELDEMRQKLDQLQGTQQTAKEPTDFD